MTTLQSMSIELTVDNAGEFQTQIKSADDSLGKLSKSAGNSVAAINKASTAFSNSSKKVSSLREKVANSATAFSKMAKSMDAADGSALRIQQSLAALTLTIDGLTKAVTSGTKALKAYSDVAKPFARDIRTIAQNSAKSAAGVRSLGAAAASSATNLGRFATSASSARDSVANWARRANASASAVESLGDKIAIVTGEARALRDELNALQRTRGPQVNGLANQVKQARGGGNGGEGTTGHVGTGSGGARQYATAIDRVNEALSNGTKSHTSFMHSITNTAFAIDEVTMAANILWEVFGSGVEKIVDVNAHTEKLITTLKGLSVAATDAGRSSEALQEYNQIFSIAQRSPFSMDRLAEGFVKLRSGNVQDPVSALKAISDALAHFGANDTQFESSMLAIMQMSGKGVVSMEELRRQLGEAMPTAMRDMANAMQMTIPQLDKLVSSGSLQSQQAIQRMMEEFNRMYGGSSEQKMKTFSGQVSLMNTEFQKLALIAGGRGMDGSYGPNSFYTEITRSIEQLNTALESPEAQAAARALNDNLAAIMRTVTSSISGLVTWGSTITSVGGRILEVVVAVKAANMAVKALLGTMEAMAGSTFLKNSGILGGIMGVGSKQTGRSSAYKAAMGSSVAESPRTPGFFSRTRGVLGDVAEQGVGSVIAGSAGKAVSSAVTGWQTMAAAEGALTASIVTGVSVISGAIVAVGALTAAWLTYEAVANRVTESTNLVSKSIQNLSQGDVSEKTVSGANSDLDEIKSRYAEMQSIYKLYQSASGQQTIKAQSFGKTDGIGGLSGGGKPSWFARMMGQDDSQWLQKGSSEAQQYALRLKNAMNLVKSQMDADQRLIDDAPQRVIENNANNIVGTTNGVINQLLRQPESEYAARIAEVARIRLQYGNGNDDNSRAQVANANQMQRDAVLRENQAHLDIMRQQIQAHQQEANFAQQSGDQTGYKTQILVINQLKKEYDGLAVSLQKAADNLGKFDVTTASKAVDREQRNADSWMARSRSGIQEMQESMNSGLQYKDSLSQMQAWVSAGGKLADLGTETKNNLLQIASIVDSVTAKYKNWGEALQSIKNLQESAGNSIRSFSASFQDASSGDNALGKTNANSLAEIQEQQNRANRDFDIASSGLDPRIYDQAVSAMQNVRTASDDMNASIAQAANTLLGMGNQSAQVSDGLSVLKQTSDSQEGAMDNLNAAMDRYVEATARAGETTEILNGRMQASSAASFARDMVNLSAAMANIDSGIRNARERIIATESPAQRLNDRRSQVTSSFNAQNSSINAVLGNQSELSQFASRSGISTQEATARLQNALRLNQKYQSQQMQALDSEFNRSATRSAASNPVNSLREQIAQYRAQLNGSDPAMAKFEQRMTDMKRPIDAATRSLISQRNALKQQVDAQNGAVQNAQFLIRRGQQNEAESVAQVSSLSLGDPTRLAGSIARVRAQYSDAIRNAQTNITNPGLRDDMVSQLRAVQQGSVDSTLSQQLDNYNRQITSINENLAVTLAEKRRVAETNLNNDTETMTGEIKNTGWDQQQQKAALDITANYYKAKMNEIQVANEGALSKTGRQWSDWNANLQEGMNSTFSGFISTMNNQLVQGTANWKQFGLSILSMLNEVTMKLASSQLLKWLGGGMDGKSSGGSGGSGIFGSIMSLFGASGGSGAAASGTEAMSSDAIDAAASVGDIFHTGGIVGSEFPASRTVPMSLFNGAPKYHTGGIVSGEVPAILQKGEGVFTQNQMSKIGDVVANSAQSVGLAKAAISMANVANTNAKMDSGIKTSGSAPNMTVNLHNQTGNPNMKTQASQPKFDGETWVTDIVMKHAQRPGTFRTAMKNLN